MRRDPKRSKRPTRSASLTPLVLIYLSLPDPSPAGHEDCLMGSKLLTAHHYDNISQDVTASEAVKIEKHITGMAGELDTAVSR